MPSLSAVAINSTFGNFIGNGSGPAIMVVSSNPFGGNNGPAAIFVQNSNGTGVFGDGNPGVSGESSGANGGPGVVGVSGASNGSPGVYGLGSYGPGILGITASATSAAGVFQNTGGGPGLVVQDSNFVNKFSVDTNGNLAASGSVTVGGGTPIVEYVSVTDSITLPTLNAGSCTTLTTAALNGFTPGASDTIALGIPGVLASLGKGTFVIYEAWETSTSASPTITIQVCNPTGSRYAGGASGTIRIDVFKH
jgi:hypothetical protein